jgi:hypothetical protein
MSDAWTAWVYQYGIGGTLFALTLVAMFRTGAVRWHNLKNRIVVATMIAGLLLFAGIHAAWILAVSG